MTLLKFVHWLLSFAKHTDCPCSNLWSKTKLYPSVNWHFQGKTQLIFFFWKPAWKETHTNRVFSVEQRQKPADVQRDRMNLPCQRSGWCRSRPYLWAGGVSGTWCVCPAPGSACRQRSCPWPWGTSTLHPAEPALLEGWPEAKEGTTDFRESELYMWYYYLADE